MSNEKPSCQVVLFPLCDPSGALSEVLNNPTESGTRLNALILAWRLELPETISISASATAMLTVTAAQPRGERSERQLELLGELRRIGESNGDRPRAEWRRVLGRGGPNTTPRPIKTRIERVFPDTDS
ncbi:MAG: hypothetical protein V3U65_13350 [Granulosicoccaceae bacterium]